MKKCGYFFLAIVFPPTILHAGDCDATQIAEIDLAMGRTGVLADQARVSLPTDSGAVTAGYTKWFGAYSDARRDHLRFVFSQIKVTTTAGTREYFCYHDSESYCTSPYTDAWVENDQPYKIHFCASFFQLSTVDQDPLMIHELSHFLENGGADASATSADGHHCSNANSCEMLAGSDPEKSVRAANLIEFYVRDL